MYLVVVALLVSSHGTNALTEKLSEGDSCTNTCGNSLQCDYLDHSKTLKQCLLMCRTDVHCTGQYKHCNVQKNICVADCRGRNPNPNVKVGGTTITCAPDRYCNLDSRECVKVDNTSRRLTSTVANPCEDDEYYSNGSCVGRKNQNERCSPQVPCKRGLTCHKNVCLSDIHMYDPPDDKKYQSRRIFIPLMIGAGVAFLLGLVISIHCFLKSIQLKSEMDTSKISRTTLTRRRAHLNTPYRKRSSIGTNLVDRYHARVEILTASSKGRSPHKRPHERNDNSSNSSYNTDRSHRSRSNKLTIPPIGRHNGAASGIRYL